MKQKFMHYLPPAFLSLVFLLTYVCLYFGAMPLFADPDTPWHLATGDLILSQGKIPATDPWSFASAGQPWYIISWLWDIIIALVTRGFGYTGLTIFVIILMSMLNTLLAINILKRDGVNSDAVILTLILTGLSIMDFTQARPHIPALFCLLLSHRILHESRDSYDKRSLWLFLPLLMILWVNVHGSFLAGFSLIVAYGLEALATRKFEWFKRLVIAGLLCVVAATINPQGIYIITAVLRTLDSVITRYLLEWTSFQFGTSTGISAALIFYICAGPLREPKVSLADKIISFIWLFAMLSSVRNAMIFMIVSAPAVALSLESFSKQLAMIRTVRPDVLQWLSKSGMRLRMMSSAILVVMITVLFFPQLKGQNAFVSQHKDPGPAIAWLKEHAVGKRILNDYGYGGRLLYETRGAVPLFIDGRSGSAYSEEVLKEYMTFNQLDSEWIKLLNKYHIDGMLLRSDSVFSVAYANGQFHQQWKVVFRDEVATIYLRKR